MDINICGVTFKKVDDHTIAIYHGDDFFKEIKEPAATEQQFIDSSNFYFLHCY